MKRILFFLRIALPVIIGFLFFADNLAADNFPRPGESKTAAFSNDDKTKALLNKLINQHDLRFLENKGQYPAQVKYHARLKNHQLYFTDEGITYLAKLPLVSKESKILSKSGNKFDLPSLDNTVNYSKFEMKFLNTSDKKIISAENVSSVKTNYFIGRNSESWRTGIESYEKIIYKNIYENIDLVYYNESAGLKYDLIIHPNSNPGDIKFKYNGTKTVIIDDKGNLHITHDNGKVTEAAPIAYQEIDGNKIFVDCNYEINSDNSISFKSGSYDINYPLVIDPELLYSTYFGGAGDDKLVNGFVITSSGDIIATGTTTSADLPTASGYDGTFNGSQDLFLAKFNGSLNQLQSMTYLGGAATDGYALIGAPIVITPNGNIAITGFTGSADFPITTNVFVSGLTFSGQGDAFVTIFNSSLSSIVSSSYLGGESSDYGQAISVDGSGNIYVAGTSFSTNFPHFANSYQTTNKGGYDVTVTKFNSDLSSMLASTYIGGSGTTELPWGMVYANDAVYLAGGTLSTDFPITDNAFDASHNGDRDCFIIKFNSSLSTLMSSTYVGSPEYEQALGITSDSQGNIYIIGDCRSGNYPTTATAFDRTFAGTSEIFISKFNSGLSSLLASTLMGGSGDDYARAITVRSNGEVVIGGSSTSADYSVSDNATYKTYKGGEDGIISFFSNDLSARYFSTFIGGSAIDAIQHVLFSGDNLYFAGNTTSTDFPTTSGAYDVTSNGLYDVFLSCISFSSTLSAPELVAPNNGISGANKDQTFEWNAVTGASGYRLQIATDSNFLQLYFDTLTTATSKFKSLNINTSYFWRVGAQSGTGTIVWSGKRTLSTGGGSTVPELLTPGDRIVGANKYVTFSWTSVAAAAGYRLQIATDSNFTQMFFDTTTTQTSKFKVLNPNATYYWRVGAISATGAVAWSERRFFSTGPLTEPTLQSPANNSTNTPLSLTLTWESMLIARYYDLQVSTDPSFGSTVISDSSSSNTKVIGPLLSNTKYYWRVRVGSFWGISDWSTIWNFTTSGSLDAPTLSAPANNSVDLETAFFADWNIVPGAAQYHLQIALDELFSQIILNDSTLANSERAVGPFLNNTKYYWRVRAKSGSTISPWSGVWNFKIKALVLGTASLLSPANNAANQPTTVSFLWNRVANSEYHKFQLSEDSLFRALIRDDSLVTDTSITVQSLKNSQKYFWRVRAGSKTGIGNWSSVSSFTTIGGLVIPPTLVTPTNNSTNIEISPILTWNSSYSDGIYRLQLSYDSLFNTIVLDSSGISAKSAKLSGLRKGTKFFWRVSVTSGGLPSSWSTSWNFTTIQKTNLFKDPNLELAVRDALNIPTDDLSPSDMLNLNILEAVSKNITNLSGLEYATNLAFLVLIDNVITDISPIKNLAKLHTLNLSNNKLIVFPSLSGFSLLKHLDLEYNNISIIDSVKTGTNLSFLSLRGNKIRDLSHVSDLKNLDTLYADENLLTAAPPFSGFTNLKALDLSNNVITDINSLSVLSSLKYLKLNNNLISDITPLLNLSQIEDIKLAANELESSDLSNLYGMKQLSNRNMKVDINGEYVYGYLDLRYNSLISKSAIIALDEQLPLIDYAHILWDSLDNNVTLSGSVTNNGNPISAVTINLSGTQTKTTATNSQGFYSLSVEKGGDYEITPIKAGYKFSPSSYKITNAYNDMVFDFTGDNTPVITSGTVKLSFAATRGGANPAPQSFRLFNSGGGTLNWNITKDANWFAVSPMQGQDSGIITVSITNTNLLPIKHTGIITITDTKASNSPFKITVELDIQNISLPNLQQSGSAVAELGSDKKVDFTLTGGDIPQRVAAFYRVGGSAEYDSVEATGQSGSYSFTIPKNKVTEKGIDYYIKAYYNNIENTIRASGNKNLSLQIKIPEITIPTKLERKIYSMFSVIDFESSTLFEQLINNFGSVNPKIWRAFNWRLIRYDEILDNLWNFGSGDGFWLITNTETEYLKLTNLITTPTGEPFKLTLSPGWNQIGNPFLFPVALSDIVLPSNVENVFWKWDETIQNYDIERNYLSPWKGYLIKNNNLLPVDLTIHPVAYTPQKAKVNTTGEWSVNLKVTSGVGVIKYLEMGALNNGDNLRDKYDAGKAPEAPEPVLTAHFKMQYSNNDELSKDFRKTGEDGYSWIVELNNHDKTKKLDIELNISDYFPTGFSGEIIYEGKKLPVNGLQSGTTKNVSIKLSNDNYFVLRFGSKEYLENKKDDIITELPLTFRLFQNYPNPFNPETNIEFYLPTDAETKLTVFNSLGSEIVVVVNAKLTKGYHKVKFKPGYNISSGLYFYKLESGTFSEIKKMLYLR